MPVLGKIRANSDWLLRPVEIREFDEVHQNDLGFSAKVRFSCFHGDFSDAARDHSAMRRDATLRLDTINRLLLQTPWPKLGGLA
ncbi:hypothetical protein X777_08623 [Ooceraea biroi]|uniref:Uncharacterized protein n=1 Tax=Ooceraea biroi TaxID=2015173 RepID=A0A026X1H6_OOCBI|nr:hypothetical protein X777_08623 [Ooceraea biroi]